MWSTSDTTNLRGLVVEFRGDADRCLIKLPGFPASAEEPPPVDAAAALAF